MCVRVCECERVVVVIIVVVSLSLHFDFYFSLYSDKLLLSFGAGYSICLSLVIRLPCMNGEMEIEGLHMRLGAFLFISFLVLLFWFVVFFRVVSTALYNVWCNADTSFMCECVYFRYHFVACYTISMFSDTIHYAWARCVPRGQTVPTIILSCI